MKTARLLFFSILFFHLIWYSGFIYLSILIDSRVFIVIILEVQSGGETRVNIFFCGV